MLKNNGKVKITHLIYKANLSNNSIKPYLDGMIKNKLMQEVFEDDKKFYAITARGLKFLEEFYKIKIFSESFGLGESVS